MAFPALGGLDIRRCSLTIGEARKGYVGGVLVRFAYGVWSYAGRVGLSIGLCGLTWL